MVATARPFLSKIKAIQVLTEGAINSNNFQAWLGLFDKKAMVMLTGIVTLGRREGIFAFQGIEGGPLEMRGI